MQDDGLTHGHGSANRINASSKYGKVVKDDIHRRPDLVLEFDGLRVIEVFVPIVDEIAREFVQEFV